MTTTCTTHTHDIWWYYVTQPDTILISFLSGNFSTLWHFLISCVPISHHSALSVITHSSQAWHLKLSRACLSHARHMLNTLPIQSWNKNVSTRSGVYYASLHSWWNVYNQLGPFVRWQRKGGTPKRYVHFWKACSVTVNNHSFTVVQLNLHKEACRVKLQYL